MINVNDISELDEIKVDLELKRVISNVDKV